MSTMRFGALVRVSTDGQEKHGESLRTQRSHIERDVELLGGQIVGWYGGSEHATPGWEKKEIDRLIKDAGMGRFSAIIVAHAAFPVGSGTSVGSSSMRLISSASTSRMPASR